MILVCGEALIDLFVGGPGADGRLPATATAGGSPFNVAVGLARLGEPVAFLGAISTDFLGQRLVRALLDEGVDVGAVARREAPTTLALVGLNEQGVPSYAFHGAGGADRQLDPGALADLPQRWTALSLGSYATVVDPIAGTLRQLVKMRDPDTVVAFDPNIRLNVDPRLDVWRAQLDWMLNHCHVLKVSDEDLQLLQRGVASEDFAGRALQRGVKLVVVTHGARGAHAWMAGGVSVSVPAPPVEVIDTVGAGDTFQAALLHGLSRRGLLAVDRLGGLAPEALRDVLHFAVRAAGLTCTRRGADLPTRQELA